MRTAIGLAMLAWLQVGLSVAQPDLRFVDLGTQPQVVSPNYLGFDVRLIGLAGGPWTGAGLQLTTRLGVEIVHAVDPNGVRVLARPDQDGNPLTDQERFVTFVSLPRGQNANARFRADGVPVLLGGFNVATSVVATAQRTSVTYGPLGVSETESGFIARIVLDTSAVDRVLPAEAYLSLDGPREPSDAVLVTGRMRTSASGSGTVVVSFVVAAPRDCNNNGVADALEDPAGDAFLGDCNGNGRADGCDRLNGSVDADANGTPDVCEDCNSNGIVDSADIANCLPGDLACADCDQNGRPDVCDRIAPTNLLGEQVDLPDHGVGYYFSEVPLALGPVRIEVRANSDLSDSNEVLRLFINGVEVGELFADDGGDCQLLVREQTLNPETFNQLWSPSGLYVSVIPSQAVDTDDCNSRIRLTVQYDGGRDCLMDGVPDTCDPRSDCDNDQVCDLDMIANCPPDQPDCADCNGNGIPDVCDIAQCPPQDPNCLDCNGNGIPDGCDRRDCPPGDATCMDCDGDAILDSCLMLPRTIGPRNGLLPLQPTVLSFKGLPTARNSVTLAIAVQGDLTADLPGVECEIEGTPFGTQILRQTVACTPTLVQWTISRSFFNANSSDGALDVTVRVVRVPVSQCPEFSIEAQLIYQTTTDLDCNANGILDACEDLADCDDDGVADVCVLEACPVSPDCMDCNNNGIPDSCDIADCPPGDPTCADINGNRRPDVCDTDCDGDGVPDDYQIWTCPDGDPSCLDCDRDRVLDACQLAACPADDPNCADCDMNGILDRCDFGQVAFVSPRGPLPPDGVLSAEFTDLPLSSSPVGIFVYAPRVDRDLLTDFVLNEQEPLTLLHPEFDSCSQLDYLLGVLPRAFYNRLVGDQGRLSIRGTIPTDCPEPESFIRILYWVGDCNFNGQLDRCDIRSEASFDNDGDGVPDECTSDCNGNGRPDYLDIFLGEEQDCNQNGIPDACDLIQQDPNAPELGRDCNSNGIPDICEIRACPPGDLFCADCDDNLILDGCEPDCDLDGIPNACEIADCAEGDNFCLDCNHNGIPDGCELRDCVEAACADCDDNGVLDACDIRTVVREQDASGISQPIRFDDMPQAVRDVEITFSAIGDLDQDNERIECTLGDQEEARTFNLFVKGATDVELVETLRFSAQSFNRFLLDGRLRMRFLYGHVDQLLIRIEYLDTQDCNGNGRPDACDLAAGEALDLNGTGVPDVCEADCDLNGILDPEELREPFHASSGQVPMQGGFLVPIAFRDVPLAAGPVTFRFTSLAHLAARENVWELSGLELFDLLDGRPTLLFDDDDRPGCEEQSDLLRISATRFNQSRQLGGFYLFAFRRFPLEDCEEPWLAVELDYLADVGRDCDDDGVPNNCTPRTALNDCNENGRLDVCEYAPKFRRASGRTALPDRSNIVPFSLPDVTPSYSDGTLVIEITTLAWPESVGPYVVTLGGREIATFEGPVGERDCVEHRVELAIPADQLHELTAFGGTLLGTIQIPDFALIFCDLVVEAQIELVYQKDLGRDCNRNGRLDACEIAAGDEADANGDGVPDGCAFDCDCAADFNQNQQIDLPDLGVVLQNFGLTGVEFGDGDVDGDGIVWLLDLNAVLRSFGCSCDG